MSGTQIMTSNEHILGGELVFSGTRVPVRALFEYLAAGDPLDRFLEQSRTSLASRPWRPSKRARPFC